MRGISDNILPATPTAALTWPKKQNRLGALGQPGILERDPTPLSTTPPECCTLDLDSQQRINMKPRNQLFTIAFILTTVVSSTDANAGPEITGIPRGPVDKGKIEKARLSAQLCGPGWTLSDDREHTPASFLCVPVKQNVYCPPNARLLETDCRNRLFNRLRP